MPVRYARDAGCLTQQQMLPAHSLAHSGLASVVRPVLPILDALYATRLTLERLVQKHGPRAQRCEAPCLPAACRPPNVQVLEKTLGA